MSLKSGRPQLSQLLTAILLSLVFSSGEGLARDLRPDSQITTAIDTTGSRISSSKITQGDIPDRISMTLDGRGVLLRLVPSGLFDPGTVIRFHSGPTPIELPVPKVFVGSLDGEPGSSAYLAVSAAGISGVISRDGLSGWTIEPRRLYEQPASLADVVAIPDAFDDAGSCGLTTREARRLARTAPVPPTTTASPDFEENLVGTTERIYRLQVAADSYYLATMGNDVSAVINKIASELAFTRMWLQRDLGLSLKANSPDVFAVGNDPFLGSGSIWTTKVSAYRATNVNTAAAAQVFYGGPNPLSGSVVGIAQGSQLCNSLSYSFVTYRASTMSEAVLASHEFGHNMGASHSDDPTKCGSLTIPAISCSGGPRNGLACDNVLQCCAVPEVCTPTEESQIFAGTIKCTFNENRPIMYSTLGRQPTPYFDQCSVNAISSYGTTRVKNVTNPWACWNDGIQCGDLDHSGAIQTNDAQAALTLAVCDSSCAYNAYADVVAPFALVGGISTNDAQAILRMAVGLEIPPITCGAY